MENTLASRIKECAENMGADVEYRNDYSGRGMYGDTCPGIVGSFSDCMTLIAEVVKDLHNDPDPDLDFDEAVDYLMDFKQDSMGRGSIVYWTDIDPIEEESQD